MASAGFLPIKRGYFVIQSRNNSRQPFDPCCIPLISWQPYFDSILMCEQAFSQGAVESFNNGLISVNFNAPASNSSIIFFHFFGDGPHKLAARVNLEQLRQRPASVNIFSKDFATSAESFEVKGLASLKRLATSTTVKAYL